MRIYCYRYMWRVSESDESLRFKIVTDTREGLAAFELQLFALEKPLNVLREYLCEYDVNLIAVAEKVIDKNDEEVQDSYEKV